MAVTVVLADDHAVVRRGMQALLESERDFSVVGVAADGLETVRLTERLKPDVLVLDLMMPGLSGLEALRILRERSPRTRVVVLSIYSSVAFITQALQLGATGYVLKGCTEENLLRAIREAAAGRRFLSPPVTEIAIQAYIDQANTGPFDPHETLTPRQREVLQLIAEGRTMKEVATILHISPRTAESHKYEIMQVLGVETTAALIQYAIRLKLVAE
jgi:DNA-binding NarL/FixJ family response regulator